MDDLAKEGGIGELLNGAIVGAVITTILGAVGCYLLGSVGKRYGL